MARATPVLFAALLTALFLAGCSGGGSDDGGPGGSSTTSGSGGGGSGDLEPATGSCDGTVTSTVAVTQIMRCEFGEMVTGDVAQYESAVLQVTW
ncbi:MAG TPA: hypothetical protein VI796_02680, partial [Candidatus Thermoplasmatota archaeon]|nr:hypothetical protein [Candidatus Thermoplasmatota archaeon]